MHGWGNRFNRCTVALVAFLVMSIAAWAGECQAQVKQRLEVRLKVDLPSIGVAGMDEATQGVLVSEIAGQERMRGSDSGSSSSGFSISFYENIGVLVSVMTSAPTACGYLNDGTTCFSKAIVTDKDSMQFRLCNNNLLRHSIYGNAQPFVAYVFILNREKKTYDNTIRTVIIEIMS